MERHYSYLEASSLEEAARLLNQTCGPTRSVRFPHEGTMVYAINQSPCESDLRVRVLGTYGDGRFRPFAEFRHWKDAPDREVLRGLEAALARRQTSFLPAQVGPDDFRPTAPEVAAMYRRYAGLPTKVLEANASW